MPSPYTVLPVGVIVSRSPGATRWVQWNWRAHSVTSNAGVATWKKLQQKGDVADFHAATLPLTLWGVETEAYIEELSSDVPSVYVIMTLSETDERPELLTITLSPYEAQAYMESGDEQVERIKMPPELFAWACEFVERHHVAEPFVKRQRRKERVDLHEDGRGDPRIVQDCDVYRAPRRGPTGVVH